MKPDIRQSLNQAFDQLPHPSLETIESIPVERMEAMDAVTRQEPVKRKTAQIWSRRILPVCACLGIMLLAGTGYARQNLVTASVIDLDVNPGFEITSNRKDRVLSVQGANADAKELLAGRNYKGWEIKEAVEALVISLDESQYITADQNTILLSVSSENETRAEQMKQELYGCISDTLTQRNVKSVVLRQNRREDQDTITKADQYGISSGKLQMIEQVMALDDKLKEEELAGYSVEQLYGIIRQYEKEKPDWLEIDDDDWYEDEMEDDEEDNEDDDEEDNDNEEDDDDDRITGSEDQKTIREGAMTSNPKAESASMNIQNTETSNRPDAKTDDYDMDDETDDDERDDVGDHDRDDDIDDYDRDDDADHAEDGDDADDDDHDADDDGGDDERPDHDQDEEDD